MSRQLVLSELPAREIRSCSNVAAGQQVLSSAAWLDSTWYVGSWSNRVLALDLVTAEVLWTVPLGIRIIATPTVHEGRIYLQGVNGDVFVLESPDAS